MKTLFESVKQILLKDPLFGRVLKNSGYLFSSNTLSLIISMVQSIFAARLLGLGAFGQIGIVTAFVSNINRLFSFRMREFVIRYLGKELTEEDLHKAGAVVKVSLITEGITSLLAFGFLLLVAPLGAKYIAKDMNTLPMIQVFGVSILANLVTETSLGVIQITNHFRTQAIINLGQSILTAIVIFIAFLFNGNIYTVLWAYLLGKIILGVGPIILAARYLKVHLLPGWWKTPISVLPSVKEMARFAFSTNLSGTVKLVVSDSEPLWVGFFLNDKAVGLYKLGLAIVNTLMTPITPLLATTYPEITRSVVSKKWQQLRQLLRRVTMVSGAWTLLVSGVMLIFGKWLIGLIYGMEFVPAYTATMILLIGFGVSNIFFWNRSLFLAFGKANIPLYVLSATALLKIGLSFWIVPMFGIIGQASLLSGNFVISVGILVIAGLVLIRKWERTQTGGEPG